MKIGRIHSFNLNRPCVAEVRDGQFFPLESENVVEAIVNREWSQTRPKDSEEAKLLCPLESSPSIRDFAAFEGHMVNCRIGVQDLPQSWYTQPAFYFSNPAALIGPDDPVRKPYGCRALDFELSVACVIAREITDVSPEEVDLMSMVAGFALFNDWSARDLQMVQRDLQLGPGKGKDFATSLGPWLTTPDEFEDIESGRPRCELTARINGRLVSRDDLSNVHFSWPEIISHASRNTHLRPGEILTCGTVTSGSLVELRNMYGREEFPWLKEGDVVELDGGEKLGVLCNRVSG